VLAHGKPVLCARVNDWKSSCASVAFSSTKIENHIDDSMGARIFSVDLVDDNDWFGLVLQCLAQNETGFAPAVRRGHRRPEARRPPFS
jgi:hypothetical protein